MKKLNEMFSNVKTTVLSMDKKNKTILGVIAVALIGAVTFGGYQLATIGKTVDSTVKQTDTTKKAEDSKKDTSTKKNEKSTKKNNKEDGEKNTSTSTNEKSSSKKTNSSNTGNSSNKGTASTNKGNSSSSGSSSSGNTSSNSGNSGQTTKPAPAPKPTPKPEPKPEPTPEPAKPKLTVDNFPSYALGNTGRVFATQAEADAWAQEQINTEGSPWYGAGMWSSGQPYLGDYSNAGEPDSPWTVDIYM